jgi:heptosyltransferase I
MRRSRTSQPDFEPHKILIIRLSSIGDCVLASPVVEALIERYPNAEITWAVQAKSASVVEGLPGVAHTLLWDDRRTRWPSLAASLWRARRGNFDVALDLQGLAKAGLFLRASKATRRITGDGARRIARWSSTERVNEDEPLHARLYYLRRAAALDIAPDATERYFPRVPVTAIHRRFADEFLARAGVGPGHTVIGLNLGAAHAVKQWPPARFARLADALLREDPSARVVIFGSGAEKPLLELFETELALCEAERGRVTTPHDDAPLFPFDDEEVRPGAAWRGRVVVTVGRLNLMQLAAMGERCDAFVTADTGPMHIMAAVGAPVVALFGPTHIARTGPVQKPGAAPIRVLDAHDYSTENKPPMEAIAVETVLREVNALLARKRRPLRLRSEETAPAGL